MHTDVKLHIGEQRGRIASISLMRAAATIAIVIIHTLPNVLKEAVTPGEVYTYNTIHRLMNFAVPIFVMITGTLMIERNESYKKCLKRAGRLLAALFVFGVPMSFAERIVASGFSASNLAYSFLDVLKGETWDVMWYLYMIIGLYLFLPVIAGFAKNADDKTLLYVLGTLFLFNSVGDLCSKIWVHINFEMSCNSIYVFYALAGYYLFYRQKIHIDRKWLYVALGSLTAIMLIVGGIAPGHEATELYFSYNSPIIVLLALTVFMLFKDVKSGNRLADIVSKYSFGIYLVHCFFIHLIEYAFGIYSNAAIRPILVPLMALSVFALSLLTSCLMKKLPLLKKLT